MRVTLEQLRALVWIARLGSFQGAAKKLNITQPAISHRLKELEDCLGTQLVERGERHSGGVRLTTEGTAAFSYAERLLKLNEEMIERLQSRDPLRGRLRLGAPDGFALVCLGELLRLLQNEYPALNVELTVANSAVLNELVIGRKLDVCFLSEPDVTADVTLHFLGTIENAWFGARDAVPADQILRPRNLVGRRILTNPAPSRLYQTTDRWFQSENVQMPSANTCDNLSVIRHLVREGAGIAILPVPIMSDVTAEGSVIRLDVRPQVESHRMYAAYPVAMAGNPMNTVIRAAEAVIQSHQFLAVG